MTAPDPPADPPRQPVERVWTMLESRIYHVRPDCPALNRAKPPLAADPGNTRAEAARHYYAKTRPCRICAPQGTNGLTPANQ